MSFPDDVMVFTDGITRSIDSIIEIFDYVGKISGQKISMEKTTIYYAGMQDNVRHQLEQRYSFNSRTLPVRYLGLPLLTQRMGQLDYAILIEKIMNRINHWANRFLSFAGRYQLICSVLLSMVNLRMSCFVFCILKSSFR